MTRNVCRRLERLETRKTIAERTPFSARILLVHPQDGLTGVLLLEGDQPIVRVPPMPEEVQRVRADMERRRAARLLWKGGATDTHDYAPA